VLGAFMKGKLREKQPVVVSLGVLVSWDAMILGKSVWFSWYVLRVHKRCVPIFVMPKELETLWACCLHLIFGS